MIYSEPSFHSPQPSAATNYQYVYDFVCEEDVRQAIKAGEKNYTNAKTIITPAARDLGDAKDVFAP